MWRWPLTVIHVARAGKLLGLIAISDAPCPTAMALSRATMRKMRQNLWWATRYKFIAVPIAAGVFYPFLLSPEIAAISMSGSSALVAVNALLLKRTTLEGIAKAPLWVEPRNAGDRPECEQWKASGLQQRK